MGSRRELVHSKLPARVTNISTVAIRQRPAAQEFLTPTRTLPASVPGKMRPARGDIEDVIGMDDPANERAT